MRKMIMITTLAFIAGLFVAGQGLGAGEYGHKMDSMGEESMMESHQPKMAAHDLDSRQVSKMQEILKNKGFDAGPVDGIAGPRTKEALSSFQESEGLAVTGKPDKETLQALSPNAETQEFFGLSPEFDEKGMMEKHPMEEMGTPEHEGMKSPEGAEEMKRY